MKCEHNDCSTCPYDDCISNVEVEPERKKKGRKKLPEEERLRRIQLRNHAYYESHIEKWQDLYEKRVQKKMATMGRNVKI